MNDHIDRNRNEKEYCPMIFTNDRFCCETLHAVIRYVGTVKDAEDIDDDV